MGKKKLYSSKTIRINIAQDHIMQNHANDRYPNRYYTCFVTLYKRFTNA